ncbi:hypothetical protein CYMTET_10108 [Cymbomonas tetramitiformis]|uniref:Uncharacterized protein n=1 Tax=Cymbomonas tetramitiformis TaxID=36881 RepID=A0AAE0GPT4_9CHLO|nr:hypothetical protein CYMTET_10108 [Cymbomonas tetramitiformis]
MKTCPGTWSPVGEHSHPLERYRDTAARGLKEEIYVESPELQPIWKDAIFIHIRYGDGRVDYQWTKFFFCRLMTNNVTSFSRESSSVTFVPLNGMRTFITTRTHGGICDSMVKFEVRFTGDTAFRKMTYGDLLVNAFDRVDSIMEQDNEQNNVSTVNNV